MNDEMNHLHSDNVNAGVRVYGATQNRVIGSGKSVNLSMSDKQNIINIAWCYR